MKLTDLLKPYSAAEFFNNYFEKTYLFNQRADPNYYRHILTVSDLDSFFSRNDLIPMGIRVVKNGTFVPADQWTRSFGKTAGSLIVQTDQLLSHYYEGATLVISAAEKRFEKLAAACSLFERDSGIPIQANVYITPPGSQGFSLHYDDHDIFTLQIRGSKRWKLYESGEELPTSKKPFTREPGFLAELELNTGDLLYMPRGLAHQPYSTQDSSIHVNFSCGPSYGFSLLNELAGLAEEEDVFFRKMVPNAFHSEQEIHDYTHEFTEKLTALISRHGIQALLQRQQQKFADAQKVGRKARFADSFALETVDFNTRFQRRKDLGEIFAHEGDPGVAFPQRYYS